MLNSRIKKNCHGSYSERFRNRTHAGHALAATVDIRSLFDPLVVGIAPTGVEVGAALAEKLNFEFDILHIEGVPGPGISSSCLGALCENGTWHLDPCVTQGMKLGNQELAAHLRKARTEIQRILERKRAVYESLRTHSRICGRSVLLVDDGATSEYPILSGLHAIGIEKPLDVSVAVPVATSVALDRISRECARVHWLTLCAREARTEDYYHLFPKATEEIALGLCRQQY